MKQLWQWVTEPGPIKSPSLGVFGWGITYTHIETAIRFGVAAMSFVLLVIHLINWWRLHRVCPLGKDCPKAATCNFEFCPMKKHE